MSAVGNITLKYLRFMPGSKSVAAMTVIAVVGIAIGVATLITTISVANGFGDAYRKAILDFSAHVVLLSTDEIKGSKPITDRLHEYQDIKGIGPFLYREALLIFKGQIRGVVIKGVESSGAKFVSGIDIVFGNSDGGPTAIFLGKFLADELGVKAGDTVRMMLPHKWQDEKGGTFEEFKVAGTFESGMYDFDSQFALIDLKDAQSIFEVPDTVSGIEIRLNDWNDAPAFAKRLDGDFAYPIYATNWQELNKSIFEAVKLEKLMFIIIMGALVIVAAFNIIGTVMLRILYKTSDISILRALGMDAGSTRRIFVAQGFAVGCLGTLAGVVLALLIIWSVTEFGWVKIPPEIYLLSTLPVCISWPTIVMVSAFSLMVCWLTAAVASGKVTGFSIVKGLHRI